MARSRRAFEGALPAALLLTACAGEAPPRGATTSAPASPTASAPAIEAPDAGPADAGADAAPLDAGAGDAGASTDARPRIGSVAPGTWVYVGRRRKDRLGYLRPGASVLLREPAPWEPARKGPHGECKSGRWWSVEPRGHVCDDDTVTRDLEGARYRALVLAGPREGAYPFDYAFSTRAPMYGKIPIEKEQRKAEQRLRPVADLGKVAKSTAGHEDLAETTPPPPSDPAPPFLADHAFSPRAAGKKPTLVSKQLPYGSMLSFSRAFSAEGRTFLLSPDLTLVPADRVRPFRRTSFHGTAVGDSVSLPIGWFRKVPRAKHRREPGGAMTPTSDRWAKQTFVALTGKTVEEGGVTYVETRDEGRWAKATEISVVSEPEALPSGVGPDERWIDVSLGKGTLTVFTGKKAVYSTLMSPGAGGVTPSLKMTVGELVSAALTPLGTYRVSFKHRSAQMTSEDKPDPESFWIADVPWVQYFRPPFAIHAAYWHDDFGLPKSGGCVNLSPEDAKVVFELTEPHVPEGWWGFMSRQDARGTVIWIHK